MNDVEIIELLNQKMSVTKDNEAFLAAMNVPEA